MTDLPAIHTDTLVDIRENAAKYPRLRNIPRDEAIRDLSAIIMKALMYRGQAADRQAVVFTATALLDELLADRQFGLPYVTIAEITYAVRNAILCGSEVYGINVASLYRILLDYARGLGHDAQTLATSRAQARRRAAVEGIIDQLPLDQLAKQMKTI